MVNPLNGSGSTQTNVVNPFQQRQTGDDQQTNKTKNKGTDQTSDLFKVNGNSNKSSNSNNILTAQNSQTSQTQGRQGGRGGLDDITV